VKNIGKKHKDNDMSIVQMVYKGKRIQIKREIFEKNKEKSERLNKPELMTEFLNKVYNNTPDSAIIQDSYMVNFVGENVSDFNIPNSVEMAEKKEIFLEYMRKCLGNSRGLHEFLNYNTGCNNMTFIIFDKMTPIAHIFRKFDTLGETHYVSDAKTVSCSKIFKKITEDVLGTIYFINMTKSPIPDDNNRRVHNVKITKAISVGAVTTIILNSAVASHNRTMIENGESKRTLIRIDPSDEATKCSHTYRLFTYFNTEKKSVYKIGYIDAIERNKPKDLEITDLKSVMNDILSNLKSSDIDYHQQNIEFEDVSYGSLYYVEKVSRRALKNRNFETYLQIAGERVRDEIFMHKLIESGSKHPESIMFPSSIIVFQVICDINSDSTADKDIIYPFTIALISEREVEVTDLNTLLANHEVVREIKMRL
jgi:hypothetical protein